jgi:hypothetical protein
LKNNDNSGKLKNATIEDIEFSEEETFDW